VTLCPFVGEGLDSLGEAIRRAAGQDDVWSTLVWHEGVQVLPCELANERVERRVALRCAILQCRLQVDYAGRVLDAGSVGHYEARGGGVVFVLARGDGGGGELCSGRVVGWRVNGLVRRGRPAVGMCDLLPVNGAPGDAHCATHLGLEGVIREVLVVGQAWRDGKLGRTLYAP
jgi:hypothetical protein